jgi:hypothetical protein
MIHMFSPRPQDSSEDAPNKQHFVASNAVQLGLKRPNLKLLNENHDSLDDFASQNDLILPRLHLGLHLHDCRPVIWVWKAATLAEQNAQLGQRDIKRERPQGHDNAHHSHVDYRLSVFAITDLIRTRHNAKDQAAKRKHVRASCGRCRRPFSYDLWREPRKAPSTNSFVFRKQRRQAEICKFRSVHTTLHIKKDVRRLQVPMNDRWPLRMHVPDGAGDVQDNIALGKSVTEAIKTRVQRRPIDAFENERDLKG